MYITGDGRESWKSCTEGGVKIHRSGCKTSFQHGNEVRYIRIKDKVYLFEDILAWSTLALLKNEEKFLTDL